MDPHTNKQKSQIQNSNEDFEKEAREGWEKIGWENWDNIMHRLNGRLDDTTVSEKQESSSNTFIAWFKPLSIAASILMAIGISFILFKNNEVDHLQLFSQYYKPLDAPEDNFRSNADTISTSPIEKKASDAYEDLEYKKAIAFYSELHKENPKNAKYVLFLGLSYINDERYDDAIQLYNAYPLQNSPYDEDILWYLALAHLKKGEILTSKNLLINISNKKDNYYANTALELITKLDRLKQ